MRDLTYHTRFPKRPKVVAVRHGHVGIDSRHRIYNPRRTFERGRDSPLTYSPYFFPVVAGGDYSRFAGRASRPTGSKRYRLIYRRAAQSIYRGAEEIEGIYFCKVVLCQ